MCVASFFPGLASAQICYRYEPQVARLRGTLLVRDYPGPPNYEDTTAGDRPESAAILALADPVCVSPDSANQWYAQLETDIREVQLVLTSEGWQTFRRLKAVPVVTTGTLFHAHTGHHRTRVLLSVLTMAADTAP
jgi:hypothetical protein